MLIILSLISFLSFDLALGMNIKEEITKLDANVVFLRHALAPGIGDPDYFNIDNCSTQRNLNEAGKLQAKNLGNILRAAELKFEKILSSQWCRCIETVELLQLTPWETFPGLNSFFQKYSNRKKNLLLLESKIKQFKTKKLYLLVTHQVVISAVTNKTTDSGGLVIYNSFTGNSKLLELKNLY